jgi:hypothetical protein
MNFSFNMHLSTSSSVHSVESSSWSASYRDFAMMMFLSFNIHTSRLRKTSRRRRKRVFNTNLKSSSVHSSKSFWNCFHRLVFLKSFFSQMLILCEMYSFLSLWLVGVASVIVLNVGKCCRDNAARAADQQRGLTVLYWKSSNGRCENRSVSNPFRSGCG